MDALSIIRGYGCSDSEDEDFRGFDGISDYFPGAQFWAKEEQVAGRGFRSYGDGRSTVEQDAGPTFRNHERSAAEQAAGPSFRSYEGSAVGQVAGSSHDSSVVEQKQIKKFDSAKKRRSKHFVIPDDCECNKNCKQLLSRDDRNRINEYFWKLDIEGQHEFIQQYASLADVKNRRSKRDVTDELVKKRSFVCTLPTASDTPIVVCRTFFLNTIGYGKDCGNIIYRSIHGCDEDGAPEPKRGKYTRKTDSRDSVKDHIEGFGPTISHYRREHAPNRLYLPSDLTQKSMYDDYQQTHTSKVSYSLYSRVVNEMKISFVKLGHEECEACVSAEEHQKISGHQFDEAGPTCSMCADQIIHLRYAKEARAEYTSDGETVIADQLVLAVDLQKVIQLPRLDGLKTVVFSQRLLAFNETFAPVKAYAKSFPVVACVWSEEISGRGKCELLSCFYRVIRYYRNLKKLTLWLHICSSQNNNLDLIEYIALLINQPEVQLQRIELKYFEPGHTFMAADSVHAGVEKQMKQKRVVTFEDFKLAVSKAQKNVEVLDMKATDFFQPKIAVTQYALNQCHPRPYVENIRKVVFSKGRFDVGYGDTVHCKQLSYCHLLSKKQRKLVEAADFDLMKTMSWQESPRGIDPERKKTLVATLNAVVPEEKRAFFESLPTKKASD
ncbi:hypothetical protein pipiens_017360 [Culex pipiens pipiens]|uniref:Uncharacterized protein n=1 Tax=Culex pipiens pipiens TaxID=38569 RepID=A0ABD1CH60_CULPP